MRASIALFALAAAAVSAQTQVGNYSSELDMTIDPNSVSQQERATWCQGQTNTCQLLCGDDTEENSCTETDLSWECTCSSNSSAPGLQYYTQTMPTFICYELYGQCNEQNVGNSRGQDACTENIRDLCGTFDPPKAAVTDDDDGDDGDDEETSTDTATASATESASDTSATADSVTSTSSDGLAAPTMVPAGKGAAALAIGILAYLV